MAREKEFLTEDSRVLYKRQVSRVLVVIGLIVSGFIYSYFIGEFVHKLFIPSEIKTVMEKWEDYGKLGPEEYRLSKQYLERLESLYPKPNLFNLFTNDFYGHKGRAIVEYFTLLLLSLIPIAFVLYKLKGYEGFFYQKPLKEPVMEIKPTKRDLLHLSDAFKEKAFKDYETVKNFLFSAVKEGESVKFPYEQASETIKEALENLEEHRKAFYPYLPSEYVRDVGAFLLWHYLISFFGNAPTGVISVHLKDPVLKIALSNYERRVYPIYYWVDKDKTVRLYEDEFKAYLLLRCIYETEKLKGFFNKLDVYNPLPFKI